MAQHGGNIRVENWHKHGNNWRKCSLLFTNWQTDTIEQKQIIIICSLSFKCFSIFQAKNQLFFQNQFWFIMIDSFFFFPLKCSKLWFHRAIMTLRHSAIFAKDDFQSHHIILIFICHRPRARIPKKKFLNIRVLNFTSRFFCLLRYAN